MAGIVAIDKLMLILETKFKGASQTKQLDKNLNDIDKSSKKVDKSMGRANMAIMSFGFAALFGGMAIKRFSQTMLTSLVTAFTTARDEGDFFNNKILALSASMEFLKFSIFDAFAQTDLFVSVIDGIVNMTNAVSLFISKHPALATFIVTFLAMGVVLGTLGMVLGQVALMSFGFQVSMLGLVGTALLFAGAVALIATILTSDLNPETKLFLSLLTGMLTTFKMLGWISWSAFGGPIGAALLAVIGGMVALSEKLGGLGNAFKAIGITILKILATVGDAIYFAIIAPLNNTIDLINGVIRASNRFLGTNFDTIAKVEVLGLGARVDAMRDKLIAEAEASDRAQSASSTTSNVNNIYVDGNIIGEEDMVNRVLKNIKDNQIGAPNGG